MYYVIDVETQKHLGTFDDFQDARDAMWRCIHRAAIFRSSDNSICEWDS
jgi:hypothetical protein